MPESIKVWLSVIAENVERWPDKGTCSPTEAAFSVLRRAPRAIRTQLAQALPLLPTDDFVEAAALIRRASRKVPPRQL